jgi:DeoR family transcriptional regulator of aga operon
LQVNITGGSMRWAGAFSLIGPAAMEAMKVVCLDRVFVGVCGVDADFGATTIEPDEAAVFRAMVQQSKQVVIVADSSKVGMVSPSVICPSSRIDMLVTDDGVSEEAAQSFENGGIKVLIV